MIAVIASRALSLQRMAIVAGALTLAACAHPVETYVDSDTIKPLEAQGSYRFALLPQKPNATELRVLDLVEQALAARGWVSRPDAPYVLAVTLAERPANAAIIGSNDEGVAVRMIRPAAQETRIAGVKLDGCIDRDHRLTILMTRIQTAAVHYAGSASEYHCETPIEATLPALVDAALVDFGRRAVPRILR